MTDGRAFVLRPLAGLEEAEAGDDELQAVIRSNLDEIRAHEPGSRLGADSEDLHKFRVATRRVRSLLRSTRGLLDDPDEAERIRSELKWLASLLGEVRDRDVLIEYLVGELESLDGAPLGAVLELLDGERESARRELGIALDSPRYRALLEGLDQSPGLREGESLRTAAKAEYEKLSKEMRGLGKDPTDDELHDARILVKRTRYAAEAAGIEGRFGQRAKGLQDVLGEHQDAVVAEEQILKLLDRVRGAGRTAFAAGRLVERQRGRRVAARDGWRKAWRRLEKAGEKALG